MKKFLALPLVLAAMASAGTPEQEYVPTEKVKKEHKVSFFMELGANASILSYDYARHGGVLTKYREEVSSDGAGGNIKLGITDNDFISAYAYFDYNKLGGSYSIHETNKWGLLQETEDGHVEFTQMTIACGITLHPIAPEKTFSGLYFGANVGVKLTMGDIPDKIDELDDLYPTIILDLGYTWAVTEHWRIGLGGSLGTAKTAGIKIVRL